jgi:hypothetical protein
MADVPLTKVHNISDRTSPAGGARRIVFGGVSLWPGRSLQVPDALITEKHRALLGSYLFFGELPAGLREKAPGQAAGAPMTELELENYLEQLTLAQLVALGRKVSPPLRVRANALAMARALVRAYRNPENLDPEAFYFTRCWTLSGTDTFIPAW